MIEILKSSTGYKRLDVYIMMNVIQLETLVFCRRFLDRDLPPWRQNSPEAQEVYKVLLDKAEYGDDVNYDVAMRIIATRRKFAKWFGGGRPGRFDGNREPSVASRRRRAAVSAVRRADAAPAQHPRRFLGLHGLPDLPRHAAGGKFERREQ